MVLCAATAAAEGVGSAPQDGIEVTWREGKTSISSEEVLIQLSNRLQLRWTQDWPEDGIASGSFRIRRAKTKLDGWLYEKRFAFGLQLNWAAADNPLEDAFLDWDVTERGRLRVKLGQFKAPFGRQELTSSGSQQFVDRSIVSSRFAEGRDIGLTLHGQSGGGTLSWAAGVFNGSGRNVASNPDGRYQVVARVQVAPSGDPGYSESDFESGERPLWAVAAQVHHDDDGLGDDRLRRTIYGADAVFKFRGLSLFCEAFFEEREPAGATASKSNGVALQAGYLLARRRIEVAGRYATWDPSEAVSGDRRDEVGAALGYFYDEHRLKLQADLRVVEDEATGASDTQLRVQTQLVF
jgi:hypothetical protein